ncbi:MAG: flavodoxin family protein [Candidatus Woesearchaeota archaeon]|jgi:multimeric flavodoxin WrbA
MTNYLLLSGSPRVGNTDYVLKRVYDGINSKNKELVFLRMKNIKHCLGCLSCDKHKRKCVTEDDMSSLCKRLEWADVIIIGTPNYYDNVSGLLKDFIDRTNSYDGYLKGKKIVEIVVGGNSEVESKRVTNGALKYFAEAHNMKVVSSYCFSAFGINELKNDKKAIVKINAIVKKVNSL